VIELALKQYRREGEVTAPGRHGRPNRIKAEKFIHGIDQALPDIYSGRGLTAVWRRPDKKTYRLGAIGRMEESGPAIKLAQGIIHRCDACGGATPIGRSSSNRRWVPASLRNMLPRSNAVGLHL
jgi:hypothetical protein